MLWFMALFVIVAFIVAGVTSPPAKRETLTEPDGDLRHELDGAPVDAETLARIGTPDTVAELVAQGRSDELSGLGYDGELPK